MSSKPSTPEQRAATRKALARKAAATRRPGPTDPAAAGSPGSSGSSPATGPGGGAGSGSGARPAVPSPGARPASPGSSPATGPGGGAGSQPAVRTGTTARPDAATTRTATAGSRAAVTTTPAPGSAAGDAGSPPARPTAPAPSASRPTAPAPSASRRPAPAPAPRPTIAAPRASAGSAPTAGRAPLPSVNANGLPSTIPSPRPTGSPGSASATGRTGTGPTARSAGSGPGTGSPGSASTTGRTGTTAVTSSTLTRKGVGAGTSATAGTATGAGPAAGAGEAPRSLAVAERGPRLLPAGDRPLARATGRTAGDALTAETAGREATIKLADGAVETIEVGGRSWRRPRGDRSRNDGPRADRADRPSADRDRAGRDRAGRDRAGRDRADRPSADRDRADRSRGGRRLPRRPSLERVVTEPARRPETGAGPAISTEGLAPVIAPRGRRARRQALRRLHKQGFVPVSPGRTKVRHRILPRSVIGICTLLVAFGLGVGFSGAAFYAYYDKRLSENEERVSRFVDGFDKQFNDAVGTMDDIRVKAVGDIRNELTPLGDYVADARGVVDLPAKAGPSVWQLETKDDAGTPRTGAAFALARHGNGTAMVTSYSLVAASTTSPSPAIELVKNGTRIPAQLWAWDADHDVAVLVVDQAIPPLVLADSASQVAAVGGRVFALAGVGGQGATASPGVLLDQSQNGLQHTAPIGALFEGGPLLDGEGKVIGVASLAYRPNGVDPGQVHQAPDVSAICAKALNCAQLDTPTQPAPPAGATPAPPAAQPAGPPAPTTTASTTDPNQDATD